MANIVTADFFIWELNIPGTEQTAIAEGVVSFIGKYEPKYLLESLGYPLYKLFKADAYPTPATPRFVDLMNGAEFTDTKGRVKKWTGLKTPETTPIANYIWYWYQRDLASYNTTQGESSGKTENAKGVSPATKMFRAWNSMSESTWLMWEFLKCAKTDGIATYPEFDFQQINPCSFDKITLI